MARISKSYGKEINTLKGRLWKHRDKIMNGTLLAIDPSCVSSSSVPGYAIYRNGNFVEGGVLNIKYHADLYVRLSRIRTVLQQEFKDVDVVVIEKPPIVPLYSKMQAVSKGKIWMNMKSINSLTQAIGAFKCSFPEHIPVIDVAAGVWTHTAKVNHFKEIKADDTDAIAIGMAAITILKEILREVITK
jgi:hypothetical protein